MQRTRPLSAWGPHQALQGGDEVAVLVTRLDPVNRKLGLHLARRTELPREAQDLAWRFVEKVAVVQDGEGCWRRRSHPRRYTGCDQRAFILGLRRVSRATRTFGSTSARDRLL